MLKLQVADYCSGSLSTYLVDGQYVRDNLDIDFTEGGNWLRYGYIPENEIWLGGVHIIEAPYVFVHELSEVLFAQENGLDLHNEDDYSKAHGEANKAEQAVRNAPNTLDDVITDLLGRFQPAEEVPLWQT